MKIGCKHHRIIPGSRDVACNVSTVFLCIALLLFVSCQPQTKHFKLQVDLRNAQPGSLYLYRLPIDQAPVLLDSFQVTQLDETFSLQDNAPWQECLYQLSIPSLRSSLYFIADAASIQTRIDAVAPRNYTTTGSKGSAALQHLQQVQNPLMDSLTVLNNKINNQIGNEAAHRASAVKLRQQLMDHYFVFADTTTSPLAALFMTQQLDFGADRARQKSFAHKLEQRFNQHAQILSFVQKTKDYLALTEIEYAIGDTLPQASFTDINGLLQTPSQWKGSYTLLEFWASYCAPCLVQLEQKKALYQQYRFQGFKMLTFSLDQDPAMLKGLLHAQQYPWPVVADLKGWANAGVNAYKIDSIPFNFLLDPAGKIVYKNIDAKTLNEVLKRTK